MQTVHIPSVFVDGTLEMTMTMVTTGRFLQTIIIVTSQIYVPYYGGGYPTYAVERASAVVGSNVVDVVR